MPATIAVDCAENVHPRTTGTGRALHWEREAVVDALADVRHRQGRLIGRMEALGFDFQREAVLGTLVEDVVKSSDIEGEKLDAAQVRSSVARRLGMDAGGIGRADRDVEGVVEMMLDATRRYDEPLTAERLFDWHASLFPTGRSGMRRITVGAWRNGDSDPMQVVSGPVGRERVHFEAPPAAPTRCRDGRAPGLVRGADGDRSGAHGGAGASLVRDHPSVRGRQRTHRPRGRRHGPGPLGTQLPALLQHVVPDPRGAQRVLRGSRADAAGHDRRHRMDGLVSRLSRPLHRQCRHGPGRRVGESAILGTHGRPFPERPPAPCPEPAAGSASRASSPRRSGRSSRSAPRTRPCGTSRSWSTVASSSATRAAGAARAID